PTVCGQRSTNMVLLHNALTVYGQRSTVNENDPASLSTYGMRSTVNENGPASLSTYGMRSTVYGQRKKKSDSRRTLFLNNHYNILPGRGCIRRRRLCYSRRRLS